MSDAWLRGRQDGLASEHQFNSFDPAPAAAAARDEWSRFLRRSLAETEVRVVSLGGRKRARIYRNDWTCDPELVPADVRECLASVKSLYERSYSPKQWRTIESMLTAEEAGFQPDRMSHIALFTNAIQPDGFAMLYDGRRSASSDSPLPVERVLPKATPFVRSRNAPAFEIKRVGIWRREGGLCFGDLLLGARAALAWLYGGDDAVPNHARLFAHAACAKTARFFVASHGGRVVAGPRELDAPEHYLVEIPLPARP